MKRRLISFVLVLLMVVSIIPMTAVGAAARKDLSWSFDSKTATLIVSGENAEIGETAPWDGYCGQIEHVVIKDGITGIGCNAFNKCPNICDVTIPAGCTYIGDNAFSKCGKLCNVYYMGPQSAWGNMCKPLPITNPLFNAKVFFCTEMRIENYVAATCTMFGSYNVVLYSLDGLVPVPVKCLPIIIPAKGHAGSTPVIENEVAATCTEDGSYDIVVYCDRCGVELSRTPMVIPAKGHTAGEPVLENVVAPTCTANGSFDVVLYCTVCGAEISRTSYEIPYDEHTEIRTEIENEVAATCTEDGSKDVAIYCAVCGEELGRTTVVIPATGHIAGEIVIENEVAATCTEKGSLDAVTYCAVCGVETARVTVPVDEKGHVWGDYELTVLPHAWTDGEKVRTCEVCGAVDTKVVDALGNPFLDVPDNSWYANAIMQCYYYKHYMNGVTRNNFAPEAPLTRAMFVTILAKIDGADITGYDGTSFDDVEEGKWYSESVEWAYQNGYAAGIGNDLFAPHASITREMLAQMFYSYSRIKGYDVSASDDLSAYEDADEVSGWALKAVKWAVGSGLMIGTTRTTIAPQFNVTRGQCAVVVMHFTEDIVPQITE